MAWDQADPGWHPPALCAPNGGIRGAMRRPVLRDRLRALRFPSVDGHPQVTCDVQGRASRRAGGTLDGTPRSAGALCATGPGTRGTAGAKDGLVSRVC